MQVDNVLWWNSINLEHPSLCERSQLDSAKANLEKVSSRFFFDAVASDCNNIARCIFLTKYNTTNKLINISVLPPTAKARGLPHRLEG